MLLSVQTGAPEVARLKLQRRGRRRLLAGRARPRAFDIRRRAAKVLVAEHLDFRSGYEICAVVFAVRHVIRRPADA